MAVLSLYKPPNQGNQYFLNALSNVIENYSTTHFNHIMLGGCNLESKNILLTSFLNPCNLTNLAKEDKVKDLELI